MPASIHKYFVLIFILECGIIFAQDSEDAIVYGTVKDADSYKPLQNVNVYIANSLIGTATDAIGKYSINNLPGGRYKLIISSIGYFHILKEISIRQGQQLKLDFSLRQKTYELPTVNVIDEEDDEWRDNYRTFVNEFIGQTKNADNVEIENPFIINFSRNNRGNLIASVKEPLEITNYAMGYKILYFLEEFEYDDIRSVKYAGYPVFEELITDDAGVKEDWNEIRYETYLGSFKHFVRAISSKYINKKMTGNNLHGINNPDEVEIDNFSTALFVKPPWESNTYDYRMVMDIINYLSPGGRTNELKLSFDEYMLVNYKKSFTTTLTSTLKLHADTVAIDIDGRYHDEYKIQHFGYWATQRLADMLPLDYNPPKEK